MWTSGLFVTPQCSSIKQKFETERTTGSFTHALSFSFLSSPPISSLLCPSSSICSRSPFPHQHFPPSLRSVSPILSPSPSVPSLSSFCLFCYLSFPLLSSPSIFSSFPSVDGMGVRMAILQCDPWSLQTGGRFLWCLVRRIFTLHSALFSLNAVTVCKPTHCHDYYIFPNFLFAFCT